jgi:hypothetical protein
MSQPFVGGIVAFAGNFILWGWGERVTLNISLPVAKLIRVDPSS